MKLGSGEKTVLLLAAFVIVVAGLKVAGPLLVPLALAVVITAVSVPVVRFLERMRVPPSAAILLAVLLDLSVVGALISVVGNSLGGFYGALPRYQDRLVLVLREDVAWLDRHGVHLSREFNDHISSVGNVMPLVGSLLSSVASVVSTALLVLLLVVFLLFEISRWQVKIRYAMGDPGADLHRFATAAKELQKYLFVKTTISAITGVLTGTWVAVLGLDFPVLWGLIAFLLNYIPTIGSILAGVPPVLLAWVQLGPGAAFAVAVGYLVINISLGNVIEPRVMGRALGLSPLVVLVSMVFWFWLWGPIGALLSAPLTMGVKIALSNTPDMRWAAILLGSARWVEEKQREWERAKPVLTPRPGQFCIHPPGAGSGGTERIHTPPQPSEPISPPDPPLERT
jgi:predicted PurR-regulated permease PerM